MSDKSINNKINSESATLEAFNKWKENTSYSEEIKKKVDLQRKLDRGTSIFKDRREG